MTATIGTVGLGFQGSKQGSGLGLQDSQPTRAAPHAAIKCSLACTQSLAWKEVMSGKPPCRRGKQAGSVRVIP